MSRASFDKLAQSVYVSERQRGLSPEHALYVADAVAGQQALKKRRAKASSNGRRRTRRTTRIRH